MLLRRHLWCHSRTRQVAISSVPSTSQPAFHHKRVYPSRRVCRPVPWHLHTPPRLVQPGKRLQREDVFLLGSCSQDDDRCKATMLNSGEKRTRSERVTDINFSSLFKIFRVQFSYAFGTDTVAELRFRMFSDINLNLFPVPLVVAYLLAGSANRQQPA